MKINGKMSVLELIDEMGRSGVLGAGRMFRATQLLSEILADDETAVFLSVAGPLVPGGLRKVIRDMID
jgi:deoxyhypusine synthase